MDRRGALHRYACQIGLLLPALALSAHGGEVRRAATISVGLTITATEPEQPARSVAAGPRSENGATAPERPEGIPLTPTPASSSDADYAHRAVSQRPQSAGPHR